MAERSFEFCWYYDTLPTPSVIGGLFQELAQTHDFEINATELLDDRFKEKRPRFSEAAITKFMTEAKTESILSVYARTRMPSEENRIPISEIGLSRMTYLGPDIYCFSTRTRTKNPLQTCRKWIDIVENHWPAKSGYGTMLDRFNLDMFYSFCAVLYVEDPTNAYLAARNNINKFENNPNDFLTVPNGTALRSVFPYMLLTAELNKKIEATFALNNTERLGTVSHLSDGKILWTVPELQDRHDAYQLLKAVGDVYDDVWFDPETYRPSRTQFAIPRD